jgi:hypothetical protein
VKWYISDRPKQGEPVEARFQTRLVWTDCLASSTLILTSSDCEGRLFGIGCGDFKVSYQVLCE